MHMYSNFHVYVLFFVFEFLYVYVLFWVFEI